MENKPGQLASTTRKKGERAELTLSKLILLTQQPQRAGGLRSRNAAAARYRERFAASVQRFTRSHSQPKWLRAMAQKKASVGELVMTLRDRVHRAPTRANQEFALFLANEIGRMEGGSEALTQHLTRELLSRLSGKRSK